MSFLFRSSPPKPLESTLFVAPLFPLALVSIIGWYGYRWGSISIASGGLYISFTLTGLAVLGLLRHRSSVGGVVREALSGVRPSIRRVFVAPAVLILVTTFIFWFPDFGIPISIDGIDWPSYAQVANYLKAHHINSSASGFHLQNQESYRYLAQENVFGAFYTIGFLSTLLSVDLATSMSLIIGAHAFFVLVLAAKVHEKVFRLDWKQNLLLLLLYGFSPLNALVLSSGYISQTIAVALLLALLLIVAEFLETWDLPAAKPIETGVSAGLIVTAIIHFYSHMLGPIGLTIGGVLFLGIWKKVRPTGAQLETRQLKALGVVLLVGAAVVAIGSADRMYWMLLNSKTLLTVNAGPSLPTLNSDLLFGFFFSEDLRSPNEVFRQVANVIILVALVQSLRCLRQSSATSFSVGLSVLLTLFAVVVSLSVFGVPARGYKLYKLFSFYLVLLLPVVFFGFLQTRKGRVFLGILAATNLFHLAGLNQQILAKGQRVPSLEGASPTVESVWKTTESANIISLGSPWERQWLTAHLQDKSLYFFDDLFGVPGTALASSTFVLGPSAFSGPRGQTVRNHSNGRPIGWMESREKRWRPLIPCRSDIRHPPRNAALCFRSTSATVPGPDVAFPLPTVNPKWTSQGLQLELEGAVPLQILFRIALDPGAGVRLKEYHAVSDVPETPTGAVPCSSPSSCSGAVVLGSPGMSAAHRSAIRIDFLTNTETRLTPAAVQHMDFIALSLEPSSQL